MKNCWSAYAERLVLSSLQSNILAGFFIALSPMGVIANGLVIWALLKTKAIHDRHCRMNWILLCISVSDVTVGLVTIPLTAVLFTRYQFIRSCDLEKATLFISQVNLHFSAYSLLFMGLEQHFKLDPKLGSRSRERARKLTTNRGLIFIVTTSFFLSLCHGIISATSFDNRTIPNTVNGLLNFGVYLSYVFIYISTYLKIRKSSMQTNSVLQLQHNPSKALKVSSHVQKFARFVSLLMLTSFLCCMPFLVTELVFLGVKYVQQKPASQTLRFISFLTFLPLLFYSTLNAVIMLCLRSNLRKFVLEQFYFRSRNDNQADHHDEVPGDVTTTFLHTSSPAPSQVSTPVSTPIPERAAAAKTLVGK